MEQVRALPWEEQEEFRLLLYYGEDADLGLSPEWEEELARREAALQEGSMGTVSAEKVAASLRRRLSGGAWD